MTEHPSLHAVRRRLVQLGRVRRLSRWFCGLSILGTALLWTLASLLLIDVLFELDVLQRVTVFALAAGAYGWAVLRYVRPHFGHRETEVDLALLVERQFGIDTDLVAAIEFTRPAADAWGSGTLRNKVIDDMAERGRHIRIAHVVDRREPWKRFRSLIITLTLGAVLVAVFPRHVLVFAQRLALGTDHYPSRTVIASIVVNDRVVLEHRDELSPRSTRCPENGEVVFLVRCARHAPARGELVISALDGSGRRHVALPRRTSPAENANANEVVFEARLPALLDSLKYQLYLGDAWTNPGTIEMVPLPQIQIRTTVSPPTYTSAAQSATPVEGNYRLTVLEGSRVDLSVACANGKQLQNVWIELQTAVQNARRELQSGGSDGNQWQFESTSFAPLHRVHDTVRFTVHATDQDGLRPRIAPRGEIRVQIDSPPAAVAATIHRVVLPTAKPAVVFQVHDDYGIGRMRMQLQIERRANTDPAPADSTPADSTRANSTRADSTRADREVPSEVHWLDVDTVTYPLRRSQLPFKHRYVLNLEPWQLHKGDRIRASLETTDYRGKTAGASVMSKPLYLEVSDRAGVLAAILEADQRTEKDLDEIIQRQLGLETN